MVVVMYYEKEKYDKKFELLWRKLQKENWSNIRWKKLKIQIYSNILHIKN